MPECGAGVGAGVQRLLPARTNAPARARRVRRRAPDQSIALRRNAGRPRQGSTTAARTVRGSRRSTDRAGSRGSAASNAAPRAVAPARASRTPRPAGSGRARAPGCLSVDLTHGRHRVLVLSTEIERRRPVVAGIRAFGETGRSWRSASGASRAASPASASTDASCSPARGSSGATRSASDARLDRARQVPRDRQHAR